MAGASLENLTSQDEDNSNAHDGLVRSFEVLLANSTLLNIIVLMGLGFVSMRRKWLSKQSADRLRWVCFEYLMPAVLMRNIWIAPVDSRLSAIMLWSAGIHALRFFFIQAVARFFEPTQRPRQGWLILMTQGEMLALLYPLLLATPHLSERALACCILWDMGGNMWLCQGVLFGVADHYFEGSSSCRGKTLLQSDDPEATLELDDERAKKDSARSGVKNVVWSVATKPLLHYCILAFCLNFSGVELPPMLDTPLWALSLPFKPGIYFVVGFYGAAHALTLADAIMVSQALVIRYGVAACLAVLVNLVISDHVLSQTITLALFSPATSNAIHIVAEKGASSDQLKLTVCTGFASTILSTAIQLGLVSLFDDLIPS